MALALFLFLTGIGHAAASSENGSEVVRRAAFELDLGALRTKHSQSATLPLRLFDEIGHRAVLNRAEAVSRRAFAWRGHLEGIDRSFVAVVGKGRRIAGVVTTGDRMFRLRSTPQGEQIAEEMHPRFLDSMRDDALFLEPQRAAAGRPAPVALEAATGADGKVVMDVLVVYFGKTAKALKADDEIWWSEGRVARKLLENEVDLGFAVANAALENSNVNARFRRVGFEKISGAGSGDFSEDLRRLIDPEDGFFDEVHALRNRLGADFVVLLPDRENSDFAGFAMQVPASDPRADASAFSVIHYSGLWWTPLAHELGHGMGLAHDEGNDFSLPEDRSHPYARGFQSPAGGFVTVMGVPTGCETCIWPIPHYSSSNRRYRGKSQPSHPRLPQPGCRGTKSDELPASLRSPKCGSRTGSGSVNAAKSIRRSLSIVSNFRQCRVDCGK